MYEHQSYTMYNNCYCKGCLSRGRASAHTVGARCSSHHSNLNEMFQGQKLSSGNYKHQKKKNISWSTLQSSHEKIKKNVAILWERPWGAHYDGKTQEQELGTWQGNKAPNLLTNVCLPFSWDDKNTIRKCCDWVKKESIFFPDDISLPMKFCLDECQAKTFHAIRCCETPGYFTNIKIECFENLCIIFLGSVMYLRSISTRSPW